MTDDDIGHDLADRLRGLLAHEPPFELPLADALRAAQEGGRRRRARSLAVRSGSALLAVAATAVLISAWPDQRPPIQPADHSNVTVPPPATATGSPTATKGTSGTSGLPTPQTPTGTRAATATGTSTTTATPRRTATRSPADPTDTAGGADPTAGGSSPQGPTATSSQGPTSIPNSSSAATVQPSPSQEVISSTSGGEPTG